MNSSILKEVESFAQILARLTETQSFAKSLYQTQTIQAAQDILEREDGVSELFQYADQFQKSGIFADSPWEDPSKLQPHLVKGTLNSGGSLSIMEVLSELRMLALAKGFCENENISATDARNFLNEVLALNLGMLFSDGTEEARIEQSNKSKTSEPLFRFLAEKLDVGALLSTLVQQIHRLAVQRPITVNRITTMIKEAEKLPVSELNFEDRERLTQYLKAIYGPTPISKDTPNLDEYRHEIKEAHKSVLQTEAEAFSESMLATGLVAPHHAIFVRYIIKVAPSLFSLSLGLNEKGQANFDENQAFVQQLVKISIHPATCQSLYGLSYLLNKGVLSFPPVVPGLKRLIELDIRKDVAQALLSSRKDQGLSETNILIAGVLSVLGQPLGVGQGLNPTCQSARGISLWAQHAMDYLLNMIARAARDGDVERNFEGQTLHSQMLSGGLLTNFDKLDLDPISIILVPHLDLLYNEMMRRASFRGEDAHKWVNPAFYGGWIPKGFRSAVDAATGSIFDFNGFVRLFYATHHPDYNDGHSLIYPNPVGIFITNIHGKLSGFHAISIQRVAADSDGKQRVYFYNPNDNSSQKWGQGISPSVVQHGEIEGESSLPFHQFVARLYAFHYNPYEQGDAYAVPDDVIEQITTLAKESWGRNYMWAL